MENVREVMVEVGNWVEVGSSLGVPHSKQQEISEQSSTKREKSLAMGDYWVNTDPGASWERHKQKGRTINNTVFIQVHQLLHSMQTQQVYTVF